MLKLATRVTFAFVFALTSFMVFAQAPSGTISGTITDPSGAVVPAAAVTITDTATNAARTLQANGQGIYSAPALPPGDYQVKVELQGFNTVQRGATVVAGTTTTVNIPLTVGETRNVVTVEAATAQINYESHAVEGVVARQTFRNCR